MWLYNNNTISTSAIGGPSTYQTLFSFGGGNAGVNLGGWTSSAIDETLHIWSTNGGAKLTYIKDIINIGTHNFIFNWNGNNYEIWVDGQKKVEYAGSGGHANLVSYDNILYLGGDNNTYQFYGNMYMYKLYETSLTDIEIKRNFNQLRKRFGL